MTCAHICCSIPGNRYHVHRSCPEVCGGCASVLAAQLLRAEDLVGDVMARVVPQIDGLGGRPGLRERVLAEVRSACAAALGEGALVGLSAEERHRVVMGRVGLALAFPTAR